MQCLSPIYIDNPDYGYVRYEPLKLKVPCGKCVACLSRKRQDWYFRLKQELKDHSSAHFITLTYNDEHLTYSEAGAPVVSKRDVQLFFKRLRKAIEPEKIRYFLCAEYGPGSFRPHYHFILFGFPDDVDLDLLLEKTWDKGFHTIGTVTDASIMYVAKYCINKSIELEDRTPVFALMSKKPALGHNYIAKYRNYHRSGMKFFCTDEFGRKQPLPRYYLDNLFMPHEKKIHTKQCEQDAHNVFDELQHSYPSHNPYELHEQQKADFIRKTKNTIEKTSKL